MRQVAKALKFNAMMVNRCYDVRAKMEHAQQKCNQAWQRKFLRVWTSGGRCCCCCCWPRRWPTLPRGWWPGFEVVKDPEAKQLDRELVFEKE